MTYTSLVIFSNVDYAHAQLPHARTRNQQVVQDPLQSNKTQSQQTTLPLSSGATAATFHPDPHFDPALVPHPPPVVPPVSVSATPGGTAAPGKANESGASNAGMGVAGGIVGGRPFSKRSEEHPLGLPISSARDDSASNGGGIPRGDGRDQARQTHEVEGSKM